MGIDPIKKHMYKIKTEIVTEKIYVLHVLKVYEDIEVR